MFAPRVRWGRESSEAPVRVIRKYSFLTGINSGSRFEVDFFFLELAQVSNVSPRWPHCPPCSLLPQQWLCCPTQSREALGCSRTGQEPRFLLPRWWSVLLSARDPAAGGPQDAAVCNRPLWLNSEGVQANHRVTLLPRTPFFSFWLTGEHGGWRGGERMPGTLKSAMQWPGSR